MAGNTAVLTIKIVTDAAQSTKGLSDASGRVGKMQQGLKKLAVPAGAALLAVGAFAKGAVDAASKTQQAMGGLDAVFGDSADTVKAWSDQAAQSVGLAKSEYGELATLIGSQLKNAQLPMDQVLGKTDEMIKLGADLAATYGGTTADAVAALSSALKGEFDPLEKYGTSLNQTKINAALAAKNADKLTGKAGAQAKALTTLELITGQTADAAGKFASEQDTAAGAQQRATAEWENAKSVLGEALLPVVTQVTNALSGFAQWAAKNQVVVTALVAVLVVMALAVLALSVATTVYTAVASGAAAATWAWLWPILAVVAIIALVVIGIVLLWRKSETFRTVVLAVWNAIKVAATVAWNVIKAVVLAVFNALKAQAKGAATQVKAAWSAIRSAASTAWNGIKSTIAAVLDWLKAAWASAMDTLQGPIDALAGAWDAVVSAIQNVISWIGRIKFPSPPGWLSKLPGVSSTFAAPGPQGTPSLAAFGATPRAAVAGGGGGGTTINVYGVLTDTDAARTIKRVLAKDDRRRTGVRVGGR